MHRKRKIVKEGLKKEFKRDFNGDFEREAYNITKARHTPLPKCKKTTLKVGSYVSMNISCMQSAE